MGRVAVAIGLTVLLSACGGAKPAASTSTNTSADAATAANPQLAALTGGVQGGNDCAKNPDFLPIYPGGSITICSNAHFDAAHKSSGIVGYTTTAASDAVLAWAKDAVAKKGLPVRISTGKMLSAGETNGRTIMTMAFPQGSGSKVTVNWSNPD